MAGFTVRNMNMWHVVSRSLSLSLSLSDNVQKGLQVLRRRHMVNFILLQFNMFASLFLRRMERVS